LFKNIRSRKELTLLVRVRLSEVSQYQFALYVRQAELLVQLILLGALFAVEPVAEAIQVEIIGLSELFSALALLTQKYSSGSA
jgi:hypothetical protein